MTVEKEAATTSQLLDTEIESNTSEEERTEPHLNVYADRLSLVNAIKRHEVEVLEEVETDALVNLCTLPSDVRRNRRRFPEGYDGRAPDPTLPRLLS